MNSSFRIKELMDDLNSISESLEKALPYKYWTSGARGARGRFEVDGREFIVYMRLKKDMETWEVDFVDENGSIDATGKGDQFKVFSTVLAILKDFVKDKEPKIIEFEASKSKGSNSRSSLYSRMLKKYSKTLGYSFKESDEGTSTAFTMTKS